MNNYTVIKDGDYVVTNKGNRGKVILVGHETAKVKIGYKTYEIELTNLYNVNKGTLFIVDYKNNFDIPSRSTVFIKHGTLLFNDGNDVVLKVVQEALNKQLEILENVK